MTRSTKVDEVVEVLGSHKLPEGLEPQPLGTALPIAYRPGITEEDWAELRRTGLGGSDVSSVLGLNPWRGRVDLWLDKLGRGEPFDGNLATRLGLALEDLIADEVEREAGLAVDRGPAAWVYRHRELSWALANVDGTIAHPDRDGPGIFEAKTAGSLDGWEGDQDEGEVPDYYALQVLWYLAVSGLSWGLIAVVCTGRRREVRWRIIERDDRVLEALVDAGQTFWTDHVLADTPPLPVGPVEADGKALAALYPTPDPDSTVDVDDLVLDVAAYREAKDLEAKAKADKNAAANRLRARLGTAEVGLLGGRPAVTWKRTKGRASTDWAALAEALGTTEKDARTRFEVREPGRTFRLVDTKETKP